MLYNSDLPGLPFAMAPLGKQVGAGNLADEVYAHYHTDRGYLKHS